MASAYALPVNGRSYNHGYSHSHTGIHLSPGRAVANGYANGGLTKSPVPNGSLFTHAESSRETSPAASPAPQTNGDPFKQNVPAFKENFGVHKHRHNHSEPSMRSKSGVDYDVVRAGDATTLRFVPLSSIPAASTSWFSLPEALTSMLVTLPCILSSAAYSSMSGLSASAFPPLSRYGVPLQASVDESGMLEPPISRRYDSIDAFVLTSGTLLVVGIFAKMQGFARASSKGKDVVRPSPELRAFLKRSSLQTMALGALSIWLPLYASMLLGGSRTGLILLVAMTANLICSNGPTRDLIEQWKHLWASKVATSMVILLTFIIDEIGWTISAPLTDVILGYLAIAASILVLPPPFPALSTSPSSVSDSRRSSSVTNSSSSACPLTSSKAASDLTLASGVILAILTVFASILLSYSPSISSTSLVLITLTVASMAAAILFSQPPTLRSESKAGLALGCFLTASSSFLFSPSLWPGTVCNGGLSALAFLSVLYDTHGNESGNDDHDHVQSIHTHQHKHGKEDVSSVFTKFLLARCEQGSLVFGILSEKDSRRIAYFTILNFGYMLVQGVYGYLSGSLGLLSDTVHMFFDCLGLVVGLGAAIASKWPTSPDWPYGWGKLNTLSGFGNGIFLMLVSVEFAWEAVEGLLEKRQLRHVQELLVVSILGLLVNIVGLVFFHSHAGHDHGHGHSHPHSHDHSQSHNHSHSNGSLHHHHHGSPHKSDAHSHSHHDSHGHNHSHSHAHGNENMHGIFLHIAADAGGSLAVILSTALNIWRPSYLWDPLATILIAILIFAAAVPLVTSSGQKLLLVIPNELEYHIKNMLQDLGDLRGVVGYSVPRFWEDGNKDSSEHGHHHDGECTHASKKKIMGVVHVIAEPSSDPDDVRERVEAFIAERNMNIVVQVERDGEGQCWCSSKSQNLD